jgi:Ca-activated chloride channel family protein
MDEIRLHGENKELKDEIVRLSKKYGVMSPYTSFLVQEEDLMTFGPPRDEPRMMRNAPESANLDALISFSAERPAISAASRGVAAVKMSKKSRAMKEAEAPQESDFVKRIGSQTFYFKNDFWIDSEYLDEKTIDIKYSSSAYTDLILTYPEIAKIAALGNRVIFKFKDKFIKISEQGRESYSPDELKKLFK